MLSSPALALDPQRLTFFIQSFILLHNFKTKQRHLAPLEDRPVNTELLGRKVRCAEEQMLQVMLIQFCICRSPFSGSGISGVSRRVRAAQFTERAGESGGLSPTIKVSFLGRTGPDERLRLQRAPMYHQGKTSQFANHQAPFPVLRFLSTCTLYSRP